MHFQGRFLPTFFDRIYILWYNRKGYSGVPMGLNETLHQHQTMPLSVGQEASSTTYSKEDMFQKNLNDLLSSIKTNGKMPKKEAMLKQILNEIAKTDQGYEIISRLPRGVKLEILSWKDILMNPHKLRTKGEYNFYSKSISLRPYFFHKLTQNSLKHTFIHELRHANQDALHQTNHHIFSAHETFKLFKLSEAETHAWFKTNRFCHKKFGSWLTPDNNKIKQFMDRDLIGEKKKIFGFLPNPFFNEDKVKNSKNYIFQEALKKNKGNIYAAQKVLTGVHLKELMTPRVKVQDWRWKFFYDNDSLIKSEFLSSCDKNALSNPQEYNKILERYQSDYGVKREDIDKTGLNRHGEQRLQKNHERTVAYAQRRGSSKQHPLSLIGMSSFRQAKAKNTASRQLIQNTKGESAETPSNPINLQHMWYGTKTR